jgi:hypothetical protein
MVLVPDAVDAEGDGGEKEELEEGAVVFDGLHGEIPFLCEKFGVSILFGQIHRFFSAIRSPSTMI